MAQTPQSQNTVAKLYTSVIEDVMSGVRDFFLDEGVDEQVLQELKMLWESKLVATKAVESSPSLDTTGSSANPTNPNGAQGNQILNPIPSDPNAMIAVQITMPKTQNDASVAPKCISINVPASCIHANKLQNILSLPSMQAALALPVEQAQVTLQKLVSEALREQHMIPVGMAADAKQAVGNYAPGIMQADGHSAGDSSEDEDEDDDDDDDLDDDADDRDKDEDKEEEPDDVSQDEEPLNSGDDVSDSEETNENLYEVDNVVVCQYDKITRARNKWKFHLKDGIMNVNGRDYVFQKANGDAEW